MVTLLDRPKALGSISMPLGWKGGWAKVNVTGGPFDGAPEAGDAFRVAVRAERIDPLKDCEVWLPIKDFSVPENAEDVAYALKQTLNAALRGEPVYVGCMGGYGRTGLFLALLAKTAGIKDPVTWVRENYHHKAVETKMQKQYVADFDVTKLRQHTLGYAWGSQIRRVFKGRGQ